MAGETLELVGLSFRSGSSPSHPPPIGCTGLMAQLEAGPYPDK